MKSIKNSGLKIAVVVIAVCLLGSGVCLADDLDDGIGKYTDESIDKDDELGQKDINQRFIMLKAKQKGSMGGSGGGNMNSVVSYGDIKGDVIIIDQSKGDKTQVVGK